MFGKKKLPVLTETSCAHIGLILKIAEVLTGKKARLKRYDFNTGRGQLYLDGDIQEFYIRATADEDRFDFAPMKRSTSIEATEFDVFCSIDAPEWNVVYVHDDGTICIGARFGNNAHETWWVGDSATNRWEEPLYR